MINMKDVGVQYMQQIIILHTYSIIHLLIQILLIITQKLKI